jgi:LacI family transcriptional regulator
VGREGRPRVPTMADVARLAGVSVTTVSFVVNDRPGTGLRAETQERVRAAIVELGYRPNLQARGLARSTTQTIGFVGEGLGSPYAGRIISGAHALARAHHSMLLILDAEDEDELAESVAEFVARRVDGVIVATEGTKPVRLPKLIAQVPAVLVNCMVPGARVPSLLPDDAQGGRTAARMLLREGHRSIACLAGDPTAWATKQRVKGFRAELAAAGIEGRSVPVHFGDYRAESGYQLCLALMRRRRAPTGIFLGNDRMAMGAYYALAELGLRVPDDVSVVGYDDQEELADSMRPGLSTIKLPFYDLGRLAAQHLFDHTTGSLPKRSFVACPPIRRASVGPPASAIRPRALPA